MTFKVHDGVEIDGKSLTNSGGTLSWGGVAVGSGGGVTINSNANNRVLTGDGSNAVAETNLTFDGTNLQIVGSSRSLITEKLRLGATDTSFIERESTVNIGYRADGVHRFFTYNGSWLERAQITDTGFNLLTGHTYQLGGTTVIDSSRNLINVPSLNVNHSSNLSGTQVYIKKLDESTNLQRWGGGTSGQSTYRFRIDQTFKFIANSGSGDNFSLDSSTGNVSGVGTINSGAITSTGHIQSAGALKVTETGTAQVIMIGNQDSGGTNKPAMIMGVNGDIKIGHGSSWSGEGGTFSEKIAISGSNLKITSGGLILNATTVIDSSRNLTNIGTISSGTINIGTLGTTATGALYLNGSTANKRADIYCTNGNLHIDSDNGNGIYLNWYGSQSSTSTAGTIFGNANGGQVAKIDGSGNFTLSGTVDGRDVAADGTKLDGIAASANNYSFPYTVSDAASSSTVVRRSSSGYIVANYFNTTPNTVTSGVTQVCVEINNDGYIRHGTPAAIRTFINVADGATNVTNTNQLTNGAGYITSYTDTNTHTHLDRTDNRTISPSEFAAGDLHFGFTSYANNNSSPYADFIHMRSYTDSSGGSDNLVMFKKSGIGMRIWQQTYGSSTAYSNYEDVWHTGNLTAANKANYDTAYGWGNHASASYATQSYVGTQVANLVDSSPAALNTLNELAAAIGDDASFSTTITNSIATKLPLVTGVTAMHNTQGTQNTANTVLRTQVNGYTMLGWINTTSGATSSTLQRVYCSQDGYIRYQTPANFGVSISPHINFNNIANKPTLSSLGYTGATNANYITNNNQLTNGAGYITSFTETNAFIGDGGSGSTHPGTSRAIYTGQLSSGGNVLGMPAIDNSNSFLTLNRHSGNYNSQIGFSSNGNMYYRSFSNVAINSTHTWRTIWDSGNSSQFTSALNTKLAGIATSANNYVLPTALTATTFATSGNVMIGGGFTNNAYNSISSTRLFFGGANDPDNYHIGTNTENFGGNYTKLDLRWHTGIRMGAQPNYGGIRMYDSEDLGTVLFSVGSGSGVTDCSVKNALRFNDGNTKILQGAGNALRIQTNHGNLDIGPMNGSWCHIQTDRASFYFDKSVTVDTGIVQSYNEDLILRRAQSPSYQVVLSTSGLTATHNVTAYSDERLKDNIVVIEDALQKVSQLRGVTYDRTDTEEPFRQTGVIAQEVEKVLPEAVITADDEMQTKSVAYGNMVGLLIEAIKDQQKQIDELKEKLETK